ncbi:MAG TPA: hypothetical protein VLX90_04310 [Steroidobacteraceae bacterium]|nr:hypothetical protein [Steroidobacteraceae bacterium]
MKRLIAQIWVVLALALIAGTASAAPIARIIVVQTTDLSAYLHEVGTLRSQMKKVLPAVSMRVFRARFAGPEAGTVVVAVEMPDLATLAKMDEFQKSNTEIAATMERIGKLRKIVSDSIYDELSQ